MQLNKKNKNFIDLGTETMPADYQPPISFHYTAHKIGRV